MRAAVARGARLATDRRMSHVFVMDVWSCPRSLLITDAAVNVEPDLAAKRDIVQNAVEQWSQWHPDAEDRGPLRP